MNENYESVIGHHYKVEVEEVGGRLQEQIEELCDEYDMTYEVPKHVKITEGDVAWDETNEMTIPLDTFEEIVEDFENR